MGDEGIGAFVAQFLEKKSLPDNVRIIDGGTGGFHLLEEFQNADHVILIDATINNAPPGSWQKLKPKFSKDYPTTLTAHDIGLKDMLDAAQLMGKMPDVLLYAVSIPKPITMQYGLNPELKSIIPILSQDIINTVKEIS